MKTYNFLLATAAFFLLAATPSSQQENVQEIAQQNNLFAFDLYQKIASEKDGNIFFSPFSISTALAMTYAGADGATATEMAQTMRFKNGANFHADFGKYLNQLNKNANGNIELRIANKIWGEKQFAFKNSFLNLLKSDYNSPLKPMDFKNKPEESRLTINHWVEEKTENRIKDLLPQGSVHTDTRLVITNAIYFKGDWMYQFDKKQTKDKKFYLDNGDVKKVPFMHLKGAFSYGQTTNYQMIKLPYKGAKQSMVVVLPAEGVSIEKVGSQINHQSFSALTQGYMPEVDLALPKFKLTQPMSLGSVLQKMGMIQAFTNRANFSNMATSNNLAISEVFHKAFVQVDEEGTEAAAATAVVVVLTSTNAPEPKPIQFRANRPFLFYIIDDETQAILFMGRITEPKTE